MMELITTLASLETERNELPEYSTTYVFVKKGESISVEMFKFLLNYYVNNPTSNICILDYVKPEDMVFLLGTILHPEEEYAITEDVYHLPETIAERYKIYYIAKNKPAKKSHKQAKAESVADGNVKADGDATVNPASVDGTKTDKDKNAKKEPKTDSKKTKEKKKSSVPAEKKSTKDKTVKDNVVGTLVNENVAADVTGDEAIKTQTDKVNPDAQEPETEEFEQMMEDFADNVEAKISENDVKPESKKLLKSIITTSGGKKYRTPARTEAINEKLIAASKEKKKKEVKSEVQMSGRADISEEDQKILDFIQITGLRASKMPDKIDIKDRALGVDLMEIITVCKNKRKDIAYAVNEKYSKANAVYVMNGISRYLDYMGEE